MAFVLVLNSLLFNLPVQGVQKILLLSLMRFDLMFIESLSGSDFRVFVPG